MFINFYRLFYCLRNINIGALTYNKNKHLTPSSRYLERAAIFLTMWVETLYSNSKASYIKVFFHFLNINYNSLKGYWMKEKLYHIVSTCKHVLLNEHNKRAVCSAYLSQCIRFPTIWYVRPTKPQISLRIRAVWSEPLLVAWVFYDC